MLRFNILFYDFITVNTIFIYLCILTQQLHLLSDQPRHNSSLGLQQPSSMAYQLH